MQDNEADDACWKAASLSLRQAPTIIVCNGGGYLLMHDGKVTARTALRDMERVLHPTSRAAAWWRQSAISATVSAAIVLAAGLSYTVGRASGVTQPVPAALTVKHVPLKHYMVEQVDTSMRGPR